MNKTLHILFLFTGLFLCPAYIHAQDEKNIDVEESAEVFLEEYSDEFQENFFEALKQKGIENYDKAVNLFLRCKQLQPDNVVVDHELAKAYLADKQPLFAQDYAIEAVVAEPSNLWYLQTLMAVLKKQNSTIAEVENTIPFDNIKLQENLALIYYGRNEYQKALKILNGIKKSDFTEELTLKINDSLKRQTVKSTSTSFTVTNQRESDPSIGYKSQIKSLIFAKNMFMLQQVSAEALENYPSQPYFYYANGLALNKKGKHRDAIAILESGLDYLVGDISLANKIYQELGDAYTALNNTPKANMYLRKIKPGF
ncbi:tetratricopeptide repeat protein [Costertonia aggregata]|uniref:Tetratricopeptide repeat protein n=1 Tax=Costertonia aggregata TaxID=343403 RepID=A0A7H9AP68_9FLAO|nr:hypothetical protein [Costertonia aggregata]QLG45194.1 hypothetical protein HYG79_07475 [Costertonia aggregata]